MKIVLLYTLAFFTAVASTTKNNNEAVNVIENNASETVNKFFKSPPKQCYIQSDDIEKYLKACIKTEHRWLHM
tara:strand:- start:29 stop:247 length:219 start_codon:yes stop_codon:yes gene_type:complete